MANEGKEQEIRGKFYNSASFIKYILANGIPRSRHAFRDMVASGTSIKLDSVKGLELIATLGNIVMTMHPQQINVMDRSNGKTIASIRR